MVCGDHTLGITIRRIETASSSVTQELRFSFVCECVCGGGERFLLKAKNIKELSPPNSSKALS